MKNFQASGEASNHAVLTEGPVLQSIFVCSSFLGHFVFLQCWMFLPVPGSEFIHSGPEFFPSRIPDPH
jgi:hypothetical protein